MSDALNRTRARSRVRHWAEGAAETMGWIEGGFGA